PPAGPRPPAGLGSSSSTEFLAEAPFVLFGQIFRSVIRDPDEIFDGLVEAFRLRRFRTGGGHALQRLPDDLRLRAATRADETTQKGLGFRIESDAGRHCCGSCRTGLYYIPIGPFN